MALEQVRKLAIRISPESSTPVYQQISDQLFCMISLSQLREGVCLPPIRLLAADLAVNPATVAKAYAELVKLGVVQARQGSGFAICRVPKLNRSERARRLQRPIDELLLAAGDLGLSTGQLLDAIRERADLLGSAVGVAQSAAEPKARPEADSPPSTGADLWTAGTGWVD